MVQIYEVEVVCDILVKVDFVYLFVGMFFYVFVSWWLSLVYYDVIDMVCVLYVLLLVMQGMVDFQVLLVQDFVVWKYVFVYDLVVMLCSYVGFSYLFMFSGQLFLLVDYVKLVYVELKVIGDIVVWIVYQVLVVVC